MKRKLFIALALFLVLCIPLTAFAKTDSKTTDDTTTSEPTKTNDAGFVVKKVDDTDPAQKLLESIFQLVNDKKESPIDFFDDTVKDEISGKLPAGTDLESVQMNEFLTIKAFNYNPTLGDRSVEFTFATNYTADQKLVAVIAIFNADGTVAEWVVLDATVVNGKVVINFPQGLLEKLDKNSAALAILNT